MLALNIIHGFVQSPNINIQSGDSVDYLSLVVARHYLHISPYHYGQYNDLCWLQ